MHDQNPFAALGAEVRRRRVAAGLSQERLAVRVGSDQAIVSKVETGAKFPPAGFVERVDDALDAGGVLVTLYERAWRVREDRRTGRARHDEEDPTDRRELFELVGAGLLAAETYRARHGAGPDVLTLRELDDAVADHAAVFTTTAHDVLAPAVYRTWRSAETHLAVSTKARAQVTLTRVAGFASYMLARLAFNLGDATTAQRFTVLAGEHAADVDDVILTGSVYEALSTLAFYGRRYPDAAADARRGAMLADHPYIRARLAAYEARALAALGDEVGARAALARMDAAARDMPVRPGASPFGPVHADQSRARSLVLLGAGAEAEPSARAAAEAHSNAHGGFEDRGNAVLNLAAALVSRPDPQPEEAAALAGEVLGMLDVRPTYSVLHKIGEVGRGLVPFRDLPAVRDLHERLASRPRLAVTG